MFGQYWKTDNAKACVVLVHGMGEHSSRYQSFVIPELVASGYAVLAYDQFGHGKTEGKRGHTPGYEALLDCLEKMEEKAYEVFPDIPFFLYGHSMGGNVVINYMMRRHTRAIGAVVTSPFLKLAFRPPGWKMFLGRILLKIAPSVTMPSELEVEAISRIEEEVKKYVEDPMVHDKISPNYSFPIIDAGLWAVENAAQCKLPVLLLHGTSDRLTDYKATTLFSKRALSATLHLIEGGYHELHNDSDREKTLQTIIHWLSTQL